MFQGTVDCVDNLLSSASKVRSWAARRMPTNSPPAKLSTSGIVPPRMPTPPWCEQAPRLPIELECAPSLQVVSPRNGSKQIISTMNVAEPTAPGLLMKRR
ncbi:hypothetical protein NKH60_25785 [Mesorhizobium sp. M1006]|uniref:hypothetical protein n=1 Tax=Mesorhizobium sp. M1006 TaxID=2957048 RepID=UPI003335B959